MKDEIQIGGLYKIKEGKSVSKVDEYFSPYVRVYEFVSNPFEKENWYIEFIYVFKDNLEPTSMIHPIKILPYDVFFEYFELESDTHEVNQIIYRLEKEGRG